MKKVALSLLICSVVLGCTKDANTGGPVPWYRYKIYAMLPAGKSVTSKLHVRVGYDGAITYVVNNSSGYGSSSGSYGGSSGSAPSPPSGMAVTQTAWSSHTILDTFVNITDTILAVMPYFNYLGPMSTVSWAQAEINADGDSLFSSQGPVLYTNKGKDSTFYVIFNVWSTK